MPGLTPIQEQLTGNYLGQQMRLYTPYSSYFSASHTPFYAMTEKIHIEEMMDELAYAGIVPRDGNLPTIKSEGHTRLTIEPDIIGGFQPTSALDGIAKQSTVAIINGKPVDNNTLMYDQKIRRLKAATENTKNLLASEVLLGSSITSLKIDFDPNHESGYDPVTDNDSSLSSGLAKYKLTISPGTSFTLKLVDLIEDFWRTTGRMPSVAMGKKGIKKLMDEINASVGKKTHGDYTIKKDAEKGFVISTSYMDLDVVSLAPTNIYSGNVEKPLGKAIPTDDLVMVYSTEGLIWAYACLEYIGSDDKPGLLRGEVLVDEIIPNRMSARGGVFSKSAPFPVILRNNLIQRYKLV